MKKYTHLVLNISFLVAMLICLFPPSAEAYIGPGAGLSAIGALLAVVFGIIIAIFGFIWYPLKRVFRKFKGVQHSG